MTALTSKISSILFRQLNRERSSRISKLLKKFEHDKCRLQLRFHGDPRQYFCTVETVNENHGVMVISNVINHAPSTNVHKGRKVELIVRESRTTYAMTCKFLEPLIGDSSRFFILSIPRLLTVIQEQEAPGIEFEEALEY